MTTTLNVHNIKCGGCATSIMDKLTKLDGISKLTVDPEKGEVTFDATDDTVAEKVKSTLSQMGYPEDDPNMIQTAKSYVSCMVGKVKNSTK